MTTVQNQPSAAKHTESARASVLIVGAGGTGLPVGYHLLLGGSQVTYLVRSGTASRSLPPQRLYCYDDARVRTFTGYDVVDDVTDLAGRPFDVILVTLDGHNSRTDEGRRLLQALGDLARSSGATVIMCAFGLGIRGFYLDQLHLPPQQLLHGFLGMLSHQSGADLPVHPPTDAAELATTNVAYRHPRNRVGFRVAAGDRGTARRFIALYDTNGASRAGSIDPGFDEVFTAIAFPVYAACELAEWRDFATITTDPRWRDLWRLACRAQREVAALPRNGWRGKLVAALMSPRVTARVHRGMEASMRPLDYQGFNRFHHGGKVRAQDVASLRESLAEGRRGGRPMRALSELLDRLDRAEDSGHGDGPGSSGVDQ